jgi:superfamily I DNA/RNA helicase
MIKLTAEQEAIVAADDDIMAITAFAGTGKTSTLKAHAQHRPRERMLYLAFNKSMADEARETFRDLRNVDVRTIHSLAFAMVGHAYKGNIGIHRVMDFEKYLPGTGLPKNMGTARVLCDVLNAWLVSDVKTVSKFMKKLSLKIQEDISELKIDRKKLAKTVETVWEDMKNGNFPMSHNGYFKLFQLASPLLERYSRVMVDEAQDLNDAMISVIFGVAGKKILVGDPYQQIYAWNGAVNAIHKARKKGAADYYLTESFRCPQTVASLANGYLSILGSKKTFRGLARPNPKLAANGGPPTVIGRTNAAIFDHAACRPGDKIRYNGGFDGYRFEIMTDLNHLRKKALHKIADPFVKKFRTYEDLEEYANDAKDTEMKVRLEVEKKYGDKIHEICRFLRARQAFGDDEAAVLLTTAHKAKGQEYGDVRILEDFADVVDIINRASLAATSEKVDPPIVSGEELRLLYVAITRSFDKLNIPPHYAISSRTVSEFKSFVREQLITVV